MGFFWLLTVVAVKVVKTCKMVFKLMWMSHLIILFLFVLFFFPNMFYHPLNSSLFGLGKSLKVC